LDVVRERVPGGEEEDGVMKNLALHAALLVGMTLAFIMFASPATAQVKIGVVDLQMAIASTKEGKAAKEKLEKMAKKKQEELDKKVETIKKLEEEMKKQMPLMSDAGKQEMLEKYRKQGLELQRLYMDNQTALAKEKGDLLEPILKKMGAVVQDIALSNGYTLIVDRSDGAVLYYDPATDLTTEVIKRYNNAK